MALTLLKFVVGPWDQVRDVIKTNFETIETVFNQYIVATANALNEVAAVNLPKLPKVGQTANVSDATVNTWGAIVNAGNGTNHVQVRWNGVNWTVVGI